MGLSHGGKARGGVFGKGLRDVKSRGRTETWDVQCHHPNTPPKNTRARASIFYPGYNFVGFVSGLDGSDK